MPSTPSESTRHRILLVEDDLDQAHLIKVLLEGMGGCSVTLAQDGLRGSMLVKDSDWDLVITDLNLPGADGIAVLDTARTHRPEMPILATTGYSGPQYADEALRRGAARVLIKPLEKDELLAVVDQLLSGGGHDAGALLADPSIDEGAEEGPSLPKEPHQLRVLAISVRPGDAEAGCGGTLLRHLDRGDRIVLLTLTHGATGKGGASRREQARAAGKAMGVRCFVGNAGSGAHPLEQDLQRLVHEALAEIRPDLAYLPTYHHAADTLRVVHEAAVANGGAGCAIFAYDPGDATVDFRPGTFVHIGSTLDRKLAVLSEFDPSDGSHLAPESAGVGARFWGRFEGGVPAEPFEVIRGEAPSWLGETSLLPPEESRLV
jgi:CheY-like chemotaxis protein